MPTKPRQSAPLISASAGAFSAAEPPELLHADRVELRLLDEPGAAQPVGRLALHRLLVYENAHHLAQQLQVGAPAPRAVVRCRERCSSSSALPEALEPELPLTGEKEVDEGENGVGKEVKQRFDMATAQFSARRST